MTVRTPMTMTMTMRTATRMGKFSLAMRVALHHLLRHVACVYKRP